MFCFIDESGELGFSDRSERYFVFALITIDDANKLRKVIRNVKKKLPFSSSQRKDLKARKCSRYHRRFLLNELIKQPIDIACVILDKKKVNQNLQENTEILYNYVCGHLSSKLRKLDDLYLDIVFHERSRKRGMQQNLYKYIQRVKMRGVIKKLKFRKESTIRERALIAADFVAWSIHRKYEENDDEFYKIIEPKISSEQFLWK